MKPRRVLIFSLTYFPRFVGGAEVSIKEITDRISPDEMEFHMVTLRLESALPAYEKIGNIHVYRVGWTTNTEVTPKNISWLLGLNKYFYIINAYNKAAALHRKQAFDITWSLMATYNSFAALFFKLRFSKVPFVFTLQDGDPITYLKRRALPLYPLFRMIFTKADRITALSKYLADWAKEMGARAKITVVPNGVDYKLFAMSQSSIKTTEVKQTYDLVTTSRLVKKNGIEDVISAMPLLDKKVHFTIIGTGPLENKLKLLAAKLDVSDRVHFKGFVNNKDVPSLLTQADAFIRPSLSEGFGVSFVEAMAAGLPVIATPVGGIVDFLKDGETGLFVKVNNPKDIAEKVSQLVNDSTLRAKIVKNAAEMVRTKYDWNLIAQSMKKVLD